MRTVAAALTLALALAVQTVQARAAPAPTPCPSQAVTAPDVAILCRTQDQLGQARDRLQSNLEAARQAESSLDRSLQEIVRQQEDVKGRITSTRQQIDALDLEIQKLDLQIQATRARIDHEWALLDAAERALYRMPTSPLIVLVQATSVRNAILQVSDMASVGARAQEIKRALEQDEKELASQLQKQQADRDAADAARSNLEQQLGHLQQLESAERETRGRLDASIQATRAELAKVNDQSSQVALQISAALQTQQEAIIAAAMQQVWEQTLTWLKTNPVGAIPTSANHSQQYRFIWPEPQAQISQPFGPSSLVLEPPYAGFPHFHTGIDLVAPDLTPVLAADDGEAIAVGTGSTGYGNYVILGHAGGLLTLYGHLAQAFVKVGDRVSQGQPIGLEGSTGNSTGPHLHFELRIGGAPSDPAPYLPPGPSPAH